MVLEKHPPMYVYLLCTMQRVHHHHPDHHDCYHCRRHFHHRRRAIIVLMMIIMIFIVSSTTAVAAALLLPFPSLNLTPFLCVSCAAWTCCDLWYRCIMWTRLSLDVGGRGVHHAALVSPFFLGPGDRAAQGVLVLSLCTSILIPIVIFFSAAISIIVHTSISSLSLPSSSSQLLSSSTSLLSCVRVRVCVRHPPSSLLHHYQHQYHHN